MDDSQSCWRAPRCPYLLFHMLQAGVLLCSPKSLKNRWKATVSTYIYTRAVNLSTVNFYTETPVRTATYSDRIQIVLESMISNMRRMTNPFLSHVTSTRGCPSASGSPSPRPLRVVVVYCSLAFNHPGNHPSGPIIVNQAVNQPWATPSARPRVKSIACPVRNCTDRETRSAIAKKI